MTEQDFKNLLARVEELERREAFFRDDKEINDELLKNIQEDIDDLKAISYAKDDGDKITMSAETLRKIINN